jgi:hypothetical protein
VIDLRLRLDEKLDLGWEVSFHERGKKALRAHGASPSAAMELFLEKVYASKDEIRIRSTIAAFFEPWIEQLARKHGMPLGPTTLSVVHNGKVIENGD